MNRYIQEIFGSTESDFMSDTKESSLSIAMNQYESYWSQYYANSVFSADEDIVAFGRGRGRGRRPRRRGHRRWRRHLRPYRWHQPIIVVEQNPRTAIGGLLVALSDKINLLWSSMTEQQRLQWRSTREKSHQKSPRLLFSKYPLPAGLL
jgi:hypothetical protein